jgi:hypothetical protein
VTAPILDGRAAKRIAERLAELAALAKLARTPAEPSQRGQDDDETMGEPRTDDPQQ